MPALCDVPCYQHCSVVMNWCELVVRYKKSSLKECETSSELFDYRTFERDLLSDEMSAFRWTKDCECEMVFIISAKVNVVNIGGDQVITDSVRSFICCSVCMMTRNSVACVWRHNSNDVIISASGNAGMLLLLFLFFLSILPKILAFYLFFPMVLSVGQLLRMMCARSMHLISGVWECC